MRNVQVERDRFFVGYNDTAPPENLPEGYLKDAKNCFCRTGEITKRTGYTAIGNDLGANAGQGIKGVRFADGTQELIVIFNGTPYKWTGSGNFTEITGTYTLNTTGLIDIVVANNNVYFFDGTNTVCKYNGSVMSEVAAIPKGKYARWFHNQLHVAGISGDPNALKSSDIGDPETFSGGNSSDLDVNPNDGDEITGLHELKDELIVFKKHRVWSMTGMGTAALDLDDLNERLTGFGTTSHFAVVNTGKDLLYPGFLGDRPVIRSLQITRYGTIIDDGIITTDIETTMDGLNKAQLTIACGMFDGRYAWFGFADGSATYNDKVLTYDTAGVPDMNGKRRKGWTYHSGINPACMNIFTISSTSEKYFIEGSADSKAYKLDTSTSDNGTAIDLNVTSRRYKAGNMDVIKKFKWMYIWAKEVGDYDVTVEYSVDGFDYASLGTLNLQGSGSTLPLVLDTSRLGTTDVKKDRYTFPKSRDRYLQLKMYDSSATSSVTIRHWNLYYQLKKSLIDL